MIPVTAIGALSPVTLSPTSATAQPAGGFGQLVSHSLHQFTHQQSHAQTLIAQAMAGRTSVTTAMVAATQAQTGLDVASAIRNSGVQSLQTLINLQI